MERHEDKSTADVVVSQTQAVVAGIRLSDEMRKQIHELVVAEARTIARERFLLVPRIAAMYISGVASLLFASLAIVASMLGADALSNALLTPTAIAAISAVTLAYVLHKDAP